MGFDPIIRRLMAIAVVMALVACEPQQQPLAGGVPTAAPTITPSVENPLRIAFGASLAPFHFDAAPWSSTGTVDQLSTESAEGYDLTLSLNPQTGWLENAQALTFRLVADPSVAPLDEVARLTRLQNSMDVLTAAVGSFSPTSTLVNDAADIRNAFASEGFPDGVALVVAYSTDFGFAPVRESLAKRNWQITDFPIQTDDISALAAAGQAHLYWLFGQELTRLPASLVSVAELKIPIWYSLAAGITLSGYTDDGLPLIKRG